MSKSPSRSSRNVIALLASIAEGGLVTVAAAATALGVTRVSASKRLAALARSGWLTPVRRGLVSIRPLEATADTPLADEDPWVLASRAFAPCYIGGWSAAGHWGLTEQLFRVTLVVAERPVRRSRAQVGSSEFLVVRERRVAQTGLVTIWRGNARVLVSSVERTLMDACANPHWVGGGGQLAAIFHAAVRDDRVAPAAMLREASASPSGAARGRLGVLAEHYWPSAEALIEYAHAHRGSGKVRFDPAVADRGKFVGRWGMRVNVRLPEDST